VDEPTLTRRRKRHSRTLASHHLGVMQRGGSRVPRVARLAFACLFSCLGSLGCNQRAIESWLSQADGTQTTPSLYADAAFSKVLAEVRKRVPSPVQALSFLVYPDHAVLQAQDPTTPNRVLQYVYRAGIVTEPVPVKLLGAGKLEDNLFPLDAAKLDAIPRLSREAQGKADIPEGAVARVLLKRNLPESMDIQFRVFVTSQRRDATLGADQNGKLLE
jgi:hypothetical protein